MDELFCLYEKAKQRLQALAQTEAYQKSCEHFCAECVRLSKIAYSLMERLEQLRQACESNTARQEYASGCDGLHRGFYAPSPVIHLMVSGLKRGRILKRMTARANPSFQYGFHGDGRLLWVNSLDNGTVTSTEYLVYEADTVYGITVSAEGDLQAVTEEIRKDGKLLAYSKGIFCSLIDPMTCYELSCEEYGYDQGELRFCDWHRIMIPPQSVLDASSAAMGIDLLPDPIYQHDRFCFERIGQPLAPTTKT